MSERNTGADHGSGHTEVWEDRWQNGRTGWDQSSAHPSLVKLILSQKADELGITKSGKAVVPGCGRGYDVEVLSRRGLDTVGVDISPTGVDAAKEWIKSREAKDEDGKREIILADFFKWSEEVKGQWDVILDYTFLCALPPALRPQWASSMTRLARPTSTTRLITLMYPLTADPLPTELSGPPFPLSTGTYHSLLDSKWDLIWSEEISGELKRKTGAQGGEMVGVWALRL